MHVLTRRPMLTVAGLAVAGQAIDELTSRKDGCFNTSLANFIFDLRNT